MLIKGLNHLSLPVRLLAEDAAIGRGAVSTRINRLIASNLIDLSLRPDSVFISAVAPLDGSIPGEHLRTVWSVLSERPSILGVNGVPPLLVQRSDAFSVDESNAVSLSWKSAMFMNLVPCAVDVQLANDVRTVSRMNEEDISGRVKLSNLLEPGLEELRRRKLESPVVMILYPIPLTVPPGSDDYCEEQQAVLSSAYSDLGAAICEVWTGTPLSVAILPAYIDPVEEDEDDGELVLA